MNHLWRVTAVKVTGKVTTGMWVEVLNTPSAPSKAKWKCHFLPTLIRTR